MHFAVASAVVVLVMASTEDEVPRRPGHPRIVSEDPLQVTIESRSDCLSLLVSNMLMFMWYQENTEWAIHHLSLLNGAVQNQVKPSDELAQKICQKAGSVYRYASRKKSRHARMEFLKLNSIISIFHDDVIKDAQLQAEIVELEEYVVELQSDLTNAMKELVLYQDAVKHECPDEPGDQ